VAIAWAQTGEAAGPPPLAVQFAPIVLIAGIVYFLLIRPEQQRRREIKSQVDALKRNDQVVLTCGIHGRVVGLAEKVVTIEIAPKVPVQIDREAIQTVLSAPSAEARDKEREKS
jgi:preprotein translocase subunit YajC